MKNVHSIEFRNGSKEELLPDISWDFPYISSCVALDQYMERFVPWHWHKEVEIFYVESGELEYYTPKGKCVFPAGSGGYINSNVLHMTKSLSKYKDTVQLLHIFDTSFIGGAQGNRIEQKYIKPMLSAPHIEIIALYQDNPAHVQLLNTIYQSFQISENEYSYEMKLRSTLSEIWCSFLSLTASFLVGNQRSSKLNDKVKLMMIYIHEHYQEKISISELSSAVFISERECFRAFRDCLHMTPVEYIKSYRLQIACHLLASSQETITFISQVSGLGSSSYFGKLFRDYIGCTPLEYRRKWQDNDKKRQI